MRKQAFTISISFSLFLLLASASAFAQDDRVKANIPFDFIAGKKMLPAGEYTIGRGLPDQRDLLLVRSTDCQHAVFLVAVENTVNKTPTDTDLVFNKVGDEYFLSQIRIAGEDTTREIPKPRAEREMEGRLAKNGQPADDLISQVLVHSE